jgi:hypothetical protein
MKCNVGTIDRVVRALLAIIFGSGGLMLQVGWLHWTLLATGIAFGFSAVFGWCPLYAPFGFTTTRRPPPEEKLAGTSAQ